MQLLGVKKGYEIPVMVERTLPYKKIRYLAVFPFEIILFFFCKYGLKPMAHVSVL